MSLCSIRFAASVFISIGLIVNVPIVWADNCPSGTHRHTNPNGKSSCHTEKTHEPHANSAHLPKEETPIMDRFHVYNSLASTLLVPFTENVWKNPWLIPHGIHTITELFTSHGKEMLMGALGGGIQSHPAFLMSIFGGLTFLAQKKGWTLGGGHGQSASEDEHDTELNELQQRIKDLESRLSTVHPSSIQKKINTKMTYQNGAAAKHPNNRYGVQARSTTHHPSELTGKVVTWNHTPDEYLQIDEKELKRNLEHQAILLEQVTNETGPTALLLTREAAAQRTTGRIQ